MAVDLVGLAALITGIASLITAILGIKKAKKEATKDCHDRLKVALQESEDYAAELHELKMKKFEE